MSFIKFILCFIFQWLTIQVGFCQHFILEERSSSVSYYNYFNQVLLVQKSLVENKIDMQIVFSNNSPINSSQFTALSAKFNKYFPKEYFYEMETKVIDTRIKKDSNKYVQWTYFIKDKNSEVAKAYLQLIVTFEVNEESNNIKNPKVLNIDVKGQGEMNLLPQKEVLKYYYNREKRDKKNPPPPLPSEFK